MKADVASLEVMCVCIKVDMAGSGTGHSQKICTWVAGTGTSSADPLSSSALTKYTSAVLMVAKKRARHAS